ncbi:hypothetical protein K492DRAFT_211654 [Lichtheimia hyalospora FSU 10163]|nr:hypothetical protein K492DRAFT_211654 [Lichtheimia hyalospora FSU 10163]
MPYSVWDQLCTHPALPIRCQRYQQLVTDSTTQLEQCVQTILSFLKDRALGLIQCANFEAAIRDATVMQHIAPSSALGYLQAAKVHSIEGKQRNVMAICDRGLELVNKNDPGYKQLEQAKAVAQQCDRKRIDFMCQLPIDIVVTVLAPLLVETLDAKTPCPYLHVSPLWRDRIIAANDGLHFKITSDKDGPWSQLDTFSQHTKALHVATPCKGQWLGKLFLDTNLCSLKELHIDDNGYTTFISSLQSVCSTLTHMSIYLPNGYSPPIANILLTCTQLESLQVFQAYDVDLRSIPTTTILPNLTTFTLDCTVREITYDQVLMVLNRFPYLQYLTLNPCPDPRSMIAIPQHCPSLRGLQLGICYVGVNLPRERLKEEISSDEHQGLEILSLLGTQESTYNWKDIDRLLNQHCNTLELIELNVTISRNDNDTIRRVHYPRLKKLFLHHVDASQPCFGWWIPEFAPLLQELELTAHVIMSNPAILNTTPPKLRKLVLRLDTTFSFDRQRAVERYLRGFIHQGQQPSTLKELELSLVQVNPTVHSPHGILNVVSQMDQLQHLMISFAHHVNTMEEYLEILARGCHCLTRLEIQCNNVPLRYSLSSLRWLTRLKQLALPIGYDTTSNFWEPLQSMTQLKHIKIYPENAVFMLNARRFKEKRPNVKLMISNGFERFPKVDVV